MGDEKRQTYNAMRSENDELLDIIRQQRSELEEITVVAQRLEAEMKTDQNRQRALGFLRL